MNKFGKPCISVLDYPGLFFVTPHAHAQMVEQLVLFVCPSVSLNLKHQIPVNRSFMQVGTMRFVTPLATKRSIIA